jgi:hypothetical protein
VQGLLTNNEEKAVLDVEEAETKGKVVVKVVEAADTGNVKD